MKIENHVERIILAIMAGAAINIIESHAVCGRTFGFYFCSAEYNSAVMFLDAMDSYTQNIPTPSKKDQTILDRRSFSYITR